MYNYDSSDKNLSLVFNTEKSLVQDLRAQLNKDLQTDSFSSEDTSVEHFLKKIEYFLKAERSSIAALLYKIDVAEELALDQENYQTLSVAILLRESQKVVFRKLYSS